MKKIIAIAVLLFFFSGSPVFASELVGEWEHTAITWMSTVSSGDGTWLQNVDSGIDIVSITLQGESSLSGCTFHLNDPASSAYSVHVYTSEHGEDLDSLVPFTSTGDDSFTFGDCSSAGAGETITVRFYGDIPEPTPTDPPEPTPTDSPPTFDPVVQESDWYDFDGFNGTSFVDTVDELSADDNNLYEIPGTSGVKFIRFSALELPEDAEIVGFKIGAKFIKAGSSGGSTVPISLTWQPWFSNSEYRCPGSEEITCPGYFERWFGQTNVSTSFTTGVYSENVINVSSRAEFLPYQDYLFGITGSWSNAAPRATDIDILRFKVLYRSANPFPSQIFTGMGNIRTATESGTIVADFNGNVGYTSAISECTIDIWHSTFGANLSQGSVPVATVKVSARDPRESWDGTLFQNGVYLGHSYNENSSNWYAENVEVPYTEGVENYYPTTFQCIEREIVCRPYTGDGSNPCSYGPSTIVASGQSLNQAQSNFTWNLQAIADLEGSTNINRCDDWDLFCKFTTWLSNAVRSIFSFPNLLGSDALEGFQTLVRSRAPFAYVDNIFRMDLSEPSELQNTPPEIVIPIKIGSSTEEYTFTYPEWILPAFSAVRTFFVVVIWVLFVVYLFLLTRRVF